jgi:flavorubredoxin
MEEKEKILYESGPHRCVMFAFDDETHENAYLSVNQYLIVNGDEGILIDPGGEAVFEELYDAVAKYVDPNNLRYIFFSHQDPDVSGSIAQWQITTQAKFVVSDLWIRFMSHYGFTEMSRIIALHDHGAKLQFGDGKLYFLPAHFLHSPVNFSLYDKRAKILFSGDIGAAVVNAAEGYKRVEDFETHKAALQSFHERYMAGNRFCQAWVARVERLDIDIIAPQHGLIFEKEHVKEFLEWFKSLRCGGDLIEELYGP